MFWILNAFALSLCYEIKWGTSPLRSGFSFVSTYLRWLSQETICELDLELSSVLRDLDTEIDCFFECFVLTTTALTIGSSFDSSSYITDSSAPLLLVRYDERLTLRAVIEVSIDFMEAELGPPPIFPPLWLLDEWCKFPLLSLFLTL